MTARNKLALLATCAALAFGAASSSARADQITLLGTVGGVTLTGDGAGSVNVSITGGTGAGGVFQSPPAADQLGVYSLGPVSFVAGPGLPSGFYLASANLETFAYSDGAGDSLHGNIAWAEVRDGNNFPTLFGTLVVGSVAGSATFTGAFPVGSLNTANFTTTNLGQTFDALAASTGSQTVGVGSGAIAGGHVSGVPGPEMGTGLSGLVAACVGLFVLARRRHVRAFA